jgi:amino acid transporter
MLGLIFAKAGNATWLSFFLGSLGLVLVSLNINQFARRSASPGSLYSYIVQGLGPTAGVLGGLALLAGYTLTGMSTLCGLAVIINVLLHQLFGVQVSAVALFALGTAGATYIASRDIQLSAKAMLLFEGLSLVFVVVLGLLIWSSHRFAVDTAQLTLSGATPGGALAGIALVVFGFSGFESSTALGYEAADPHRTIPRSVTQSVLISGVFFTVMAYIVVLGFADGRQALASNEAPLHTLAHAIGWARLGTIIDVGIVLSFFSCTLASINSSARILYSMAHHGLISGALGQAHLRNQTPHVAIALIAVLTFSLPSAVYLAGVSAFECQGYFATLCSFGFIVVYGLISLAAPAYLARTGRLTRRARWYSIGGLSFMALPVAGTLGIPGSELFPTPTGLGAVFIGIFALYMAGGLLWLVLQRQRRPRLVAQLQAAISHMDLKRAQVEPREPDIVPTTLKSKVI